ncbi:MAG: low molecular weight phosphatase family protein [Bacteroidota bacterium]
MKHILFVCTGNYYRSRFAEILFNHYSAKSNTDSRSFSRGLEVFKANNEGPISKYAHSYLRDIDLEIDMARFPKQIDEIDFLISDEIILLDEAEHRPMMAQYFPELVDDVTYWDFQDIQFKSPNEVLPLLERKIRGLLKSS